MNTRKQTPIYSGVVCYFPRALKYVSQVSYAGNQQHHPDKPLHWDMSKSTDEPDALMRHLTDHAQGNIVDDDGILHLGKVAWRSLALLERHLIENEYGESNKENLQVSTEEIESLSGRRRLGQ